MDNIFYSRKSADYVNWVSYGLLALGYKKGDKVATISGNKPEWNFVDMGLAQAGFDSCSDLSDNRYR